MSSQQAHKHSISAASSDRGSTGRGSTRPLIKLVQILLIASLLFTVWSAARLEPWSNAGSARLESPDVIPWTNVNPIGTNTFLSVEVEVWKRERTMEMVAESGAGWIRQGFPWNDIEPRKGEHWDARYQQDSWAKFDNIVDLAEQNGVRIIARLDQTPAWARPPGSDAATPPSNHADYGDFVYDFVNRYKGRISFIQIWNEPNLAREWGGGIDPAGYASLLETAARRAKEANPDVVILSAPMAMTTENSARATDEFTYWQALYDLGIGEWFDIMSANVYGLSDPYHADPDPMVLNTRRVELLRDLAVRNGDEDKAIWFNEYGWNAAPDSFPPEKLIWSRVDEATQAEWTAAGIGYAREHWEWFGVANIWYFRHVGNISRDDADHYFRMVDVEFTPRDVYNAVQSMFTTFAVAEPGKHGMLESPVTSFGSWDLNRGEQYEDGFSISAESGSSLSVRFRGSALDLHLPPGQSHGSISVAVHAGVSTDNSPIRQRNVELPAKGGLVRLTSGVVPHPDNSAAATYTALVTIDQDSRLEVDFVRVSYERSYTNVIAGAVSTVLAGIGLFGLLQRRARAR